MTGTTSPSGRARARWPARAGLVLVGAFFGLLAGEGLLRLFASQATELPPRIAQLLREEPGLEQELQTAVARHWQRHTLDPVLGARPVLDGHVYGAHGALVNDYPLEKGPGVERLLFVGDSVTRRGRLVAAVRELLDREGREWWNAGVEGFGADQVARYYELFDREIHPDHVIFSFHNNDFSTTPVVFRDETGEIVVVQPKRPASHPSPWLMRHSRVYRTWALWRMRGRDEPGIVDEVRAALGRLRDQVAEDGARFTVLLLPVFADEAAWHAGQRESRARALAILDELGIEYYDLIEPLRLALRDGVDPHESPGDGAHPSAAVCAYFARHLADAGFLGAPAAGPR